MNFHISMHSCLISQALLLSACASQVASRTGPLQGDPVVCGVVRVLPSVALGEDRILNVALPASYESGDDH
jgi:hypothetical protein